LATDPELVRQVGKGDQTAFQRLYDRFADRVYRYAYTILHDRHLCEEVAQETMIAVWNGASRFEGRSRASTWIFGIARNQAYSLARKERRAETTPIPVLVHPDHAPQLLQRERIAGALTQLPDEQREVVFLTFYEGLSYGEISRILGVPEGTVKSRMYHAKRKLAEALT